MTAQDDTEPEASPPDPEENLSTDERELEPFRHLHTWELAENRLQWLERAAAEQKHAKQPTLPANATKTLEFPDPILSLYEPMRNARRNLVPRTPRAADLGFGAGDTNTRQDLPTSLPLELAPPVEQPLTPDTVDTEPELRHSPPPAPPASVDVRALSTEDVKAKQVPPSTPALTTETADWVVRERAHRKRRWQWAAVVAGCVAIAAVFLVVAFQNRERTESSAVVEKPKPASVARQVTQESASEGHSANGSARRVGSPAASPWPSAPARTKLNAATPSPTDNAPKPEQPSSKLPNQRDPSKKTRRSDKSRFESRPPASSPPAVDELPLDNAFSPTPSF